MKTNRIVIVQCRLSSTRLPGKALMELGGKPILSWALSSMHKVKADRYFVATDFDSYDLLLPICQKNDFECFAGDLNDVLKRFVDLLNTVNCKTVIRATADNPFLFYEAAEESVELFEEKNKGKNHCDYLTFSGLPHGSGVEIFSADSLKSAILQTSDPYDHEHVGPALYNHKDKYICDFILAPRKYNFPDYRTTIDTFSDYLRATSIVDYLGLENAPYQSQQIIDACGQKQIQNPVVLVPSVTKGHGTGHLRRCLALASEKPFFVYIPIDKTLEETDSVILEYLEKGLKKSQIINLLPDQTFSPIIVTDNFELSKNEAQSYAQAKALISIDDGSDFSDYCDYLLDIIPSYKTERKANKFDSSFIEKPENVRPQVNEKPQGDCGPQVDDRPQGDCHSPGDEKIEPPKNPPFSTVLICLGGEDPAGLTLPTAKTLAKLYPQTKITAVFSGDYNNNAETNLEIVKPIKNLKNQLYKYDLVFTHYGLTAFEAAYAGCRVILLPTSKLHVNLAQKYHFAYLAEKNISEDSIKNAISDAIKSGNIYPKLPVSADQGNLSDFICSLAGGKRLLCPVCGKFQQNPDEIVSRNASRTYRRCQTCGLVYMSFTIEEDKKYQKSYFFEDYKKQYGKTYEEDFESIKKQGFRRLDHIKTICGNLQEKNLLDIGCAYGPFLSAAFDYKINPFGTDISDDAVSYVQNKLKFPATVSAFPSINTEEEFGISQFDLVTMWYVIEHFKDLDSVLTKVSKIVKTGGIFAFSTPSGQGISAKSDKDHFYSISPSDHYSVWEATGANKVLEKYGFKVVKIVSTGHHPERFPIIKKTNAQPGSLKWKFVDNLSKTRNLGDTMEIYCKKIWS